MEGKSSLLVYLDGEQLFHLQSRYVIVWQGLRYNMVQSMFLMLLYTNVSSNCTFNR